MLKFISEISFSSAGQSIIHRSQPQLIKCQKWASFFMTFVLQSILGHHMKFAAFTEIAAS
jgi:dipeptide/tripeptide permease